MDETKNETTQKRERKTPEQLKTEFTEWQEKTNKKLLKLFLQQRSNIEPEKKAEIENKIAEIEKSILQRKALLDKKLALLYEQIAQANDTSNERKERTHKLCVIGGLVEKAGLDNLSEAALLGALLQQQEYLKTHPHMVKQWEARGSAAMKAKN